MKQIKYKCKDCNHKFSGDFSTSCCPICGSTKIVTDGGGNIGKWGKRIGIVIGVLLAGILVFKIINKPHPIIASVDVNTMKNSISVSSEKTSKSDLRKLYKVIVKDSNGNDFATLFFNRNSNSSTSCYISEMVDGETYTFYFVERKSGNKPKNFRWKGNSTYTKPLPPTQPVISVSKTADCVSQRYTITIAVEKGHATEYYLDDKKQDSNVFENVSPRQDDYIVKVYDAENNLYSEPLNVTCSANGVRRFHITEEEIQKVFDDIANGKLYVGDALEKINHGKNMRLARSIDNCSQLEEVLNYSRTNSVHYNVHVSISQKDCFDEIKSISLTH